MRLRQMAARIERRDQDYRKLRGLNEQKGQCYLKLAKMAENIYRPLRYVRPHAYVFKRDNGN